MNPNVQKALQNSAKRPLKTSYQNPFAMRRTMAGDIRVAPTVEALKKTGMSHAAARTASEAKAYYAGDKVDARATTAGMLRNYRKTKMLSAADRAALLEFARGDQVAKWLPTQRPDVIKELMPDLPHATSKPGAVRAALTGAAESRNNIAAYVKMSRRRRDTAKEWAKGLKF